jgi:hypothetical protein
VWGRARTLAPFGMHRAAVRATEVPSTLWYRGSDWRRETPAGPGAKAAGSWPAHARTQPSPKENRSARGSARAKSVEAQGPRCLYNLGLGYSQGSSSRWMERNGTGGRRGSHHRRTREKRISVYLGVGVSLYTVRVTLKDNSYSRLDEPKGRHLCLRALYSAPLN